MLKISLAIILCLNSFVSNAEQSKQEIIEYCKRTFISYGNQIVLQCIKDELDAYSQIQELSKN